MEERLLIIDTDAGIDDALAIFMSLRAHKNPTIPWKVIAITCVAGNTELDNVCVNVTRILQTAELSSEIPIYRGAERGLIHHIKRSDNPYHGKDGFGDADLPEITAKLEKEHAVLALIRLVHQYEGKLTVMAIGPLTNIALAMNMDPSFSKSIKELCVMGGNVGGVGNIQACAEFNFWADPEAAHIVLDAPFPKMIMLVPWETCKIESRMDVEWRKNKLGGLNTVEINLLNKIEEKILVRNGNIHSGWVSCDALVPAAMLNPKVMKATEDHYCTIELHGSQTRGQMVLDHPRLSNQPSNVQAVTKVDVEEYCKMLMWGLGGPDLNY